MFYKIAVLKNFTKFTGKQNGNIKPNLIQILSES